MANFNLNKYNWTGDIGGPQHGYGYFFSYDKIRDEYEGISASFYDSHTRMLILEFSIGRSELNKIALDKSILSVCGYDKEPGKLSDYHLIDSYIAHGGLGDSYSYEPPTYFDESIYDWVDYNFDYSNCNTVMGILNSKIKLSQFKYDENAWEALSKGRYDNGY